MGLIVVDASVATKWVLLESDTAIAKSFLSDEFRLFAPSIIRLEVGGAASRRFRAGEIAESVARIACDHWEELLDDAFTQLLPLEELYPTALELSFRAKHPIPDCLYVAAAQSLHCPLITADRTLHERLTPHFDQIQLLQRAA